MIIFLYGPDNYRREARQRLYIIEFQKKYTGLAPARFDGAQNDEVLAAKLFLQNQSLFEPKKIATLSHFFEVEEAADLKKRIKDKLEDKDTWLILSESNKPSALWSFLLKPPVVTERFEYLEGRDWQKFVREAILAKELELTPSLVQALAVAYEKDTWRLMTELARLQFLRKKDIASEDCPELMLPEISNFWTTLTALRDGSIKERLTTLETLFYEHEPAAKIFNLMTSQGAELLPLLAEYDLAVKSGKLDYEEVLLDLAMR